MLPQGRRLGIDYGDVRVGLALSDPAGILATPLTTLSTENAVLEVIQLIDQHFVRVVYIGLPLHLSGTESASSKKARDFALTLMQSSNGEVSFRLIDERLSTKSATNSAHEAGREVSKSNINQLAAAAILEFALNVERAQEVLAGHEI